MQPKNKIKKLFEVFGFQSKNPDLYVEALTHKSFLNENKRMKKNYERLEWLGDSILQYYVSYYIYKKYKKIDPGEMTLIRWHVVSSKSLSEFSKQLNLYEFANLSKSIISVKDKFYADIFEAFIGALYIDNQKSVLEIVLKNTVYNQINNLKDNFSILKNAKTLFQEKVQIHNKKSIQYKISETHGKDHNKTFVCNLYLDDIMMGRGEGRTKTKAETLAAQNALDKFKD